MSVAGFALVADVHDFNDDIVDDIGNDMAAVREGDEQLTVIDRGIEREASSFGEGDEDKALNQPNVPLERAFGVD